MANKLTKVFMAVLLVACMLVSAGAAMADGTVYEVFDESEFITALGTAGNGDTIKLTGKVALNNPLVISNKNLTIDLNGNELELKNYNNLLNENADISIVGGTLTFSDQGSGGSGIFYIGDGQFNNKTSASLTLSGVTVNANNINTRFGLFLVQSGSTFRAQPNGQTQTVINVLGDKSDGGGAIKVNEGDGKTEKIYITNSTVNYSNAVKDGTAIVTDSSSVLEIVGSKIDIKNADNGINLLCDTLIDSSTITIDGNARRGITQYYSGVTTTIRNGSTVKLTNCGEGGLEYKADPANCPVIVNHSTFITDRIVDADKTEVSLEAILKMKGIIQINTKERVEDGLNIIEPVPIVPQPAPVAPVAPAAPSVPQTGDNSALLLWAGLMLTSVLGMVWAGKKRSA